ATSSTARSWCAARTLRTCPTLRGGRSLLRSGCRCYADREDKDERGRCPRTPSTKPHGGPPSCEVSILPAKGASGISRATLCGLPLNHADRPRQCAACL